MTKQSNCGSHVGTALEEVRIEKSTEMESLIRRRRIILLFRYSIKMLYDTFYRKSIPQIEIWYPQFLNHRLFLHYTRRYLIFTNHAILLIMLQLIYYSSYFYLPNISKKVEIKVARITIKLNLPRYFKFMPIISFFITK